jgi:hypothetical protein
MRVEKLWLNFSEPKRLHDARYLGVNFRDRQTIKRRLNRIRQRIARLSFPEKHLVLDWLGDHLNGECENGSLLLS